MSNSLSDLVTSTSWWEVVGSHRSLVREYYGSQSFIDDYYVLEPEICYAPTTSTQYGIIQRQLELVDCMVASL